MAIDKSAPAAVRLRRYVESALVGPTADAIGVAAQQLLGHTGADLAEAVKKKVLAQLKGPCAKARYDYAVKLVDAWLVQDIASFAGRD